MSGVLIVGGGQGGARCAIELREAGYTLPITVLSDEAYVPYERPPLSKEVLSLGATPGQPQVVPQSELNAAKISLCLNQAAERLDPANRRVATVAGEQFDYDYLVLATGARARRLSIPGADLKSVLTLRDAPDALLMREQMSRARRVGVIGGGVLGLEIAAACRRAGLETSVLEQAEHCLKRMLPLPAAQAVMNFHQENCVRIQCNTKVRRLLGEDKVEAIELSDGEVIQCDLVVVAIGSMPNDALIAMAGGRCEGGVLIDKFCRTSLPGVFAIGDVAVDSSTHRRKESWDNANRQAATVAAAITGASLPQETPDWFWTDQYDLNIQILGAPACGTRLVERAGSNAQQKIQFYLNDQVVAGAVLFNSGRERRTVAQLIGQRIEPSALSTAQESLKRLVSR